MLHIWRCRGNTLAPQDRKPVTGKSGSSICLWSVSSCDPKLSKCCCPSFIHCLVFLWIQEATQKTPKVSMGLGNASHPLCNPWKHSSAGIDGLQRHSSAAFLQNSKGSGPYGAVNRNAVLWMQRKQTSLSCWLTLSRHQKPSWRLLLLVLSQSDTIQHKKSFPESQDAWASSSILKEDWLIFILCVCAFCMPVYLCITFVQCSLGPEEGVRALGVGVTDNWKQPYRHLEWNLGHLEEQPVLLTNGPSHQPLTILPI